MLDIIYAISGTFEINTNAESHQKLGPTILSLYDGYGPVWWQTNIPIPKIRKLAYVISASTEAITECDPHFPVMTLPFEKLSGQIDC